LTFTANQLTPNQNKYLSMRRKLKLMSSDNQTPPSIIGIYLPITSYVTRFDTRIKTKHRQHTITKQKQSETPETLIPALLFLVIDIITTEQSEQTEE
jgi:hypothetical protein